MDATFWSFDDDNGPNAWSDGAPVDFSPSATAQAFYDIGSVNLAVETGDGTATNGTTPVDDSGAVTVNPSANTEISAQLTAVNAGSGTPPGPVTIDVVFGSSDVTAQLGLSNASEAAPTEDAETGEPDYFWALPAMALSRLREQRHCHRDSRHSGHGRFRAPGGRDVQPRMVRAAALGVGPATAMARLLLHQFDQRAE